MSRRFPKLPRWSEPFLFAALLSGLMSLLVSGISTFHVIGLSGALIGGWMSSWVASWMVAFPSVLVIAPIVRRTVRVLIED